MQGYAQLTVRSMRRGQFARAIRALAGIAALALAPEAVAQSSAGIDVTTYHYDNFRTGWNDQETVLTPANVGGAQFAKLHSVALDEQVDAQPLLLRNVTIAGGAHDVVYVATQNNTVYAIDAGSGAVLATRSLGTPVPIILLPGACNNGSSVVGVSSTPVIDPVTHALYVIADTLTLAGPVYKLYRLDPSTLADESPPATVATTRSLSDGSSYPFTALVSRQRAALLLSRGNVYAAFASFCDHVHQLSRGWVIGWNAATLARLGGGYLDDREATSPTSFFLSSVWMSGYGPATDERGNLFFVTSNTDPAGGTYNAPLNLAESVIKLSPGLGKIQDYFTPTNFASLDAIDEDFGSGGALVLPRQPGSAPELAVAAGKDGRMFLLDRAQLGKLGAGGIDNVLGTFPIGVCFCGPSYFVGADGVGRVVSSGGKQIEIWRLDFSAKTTLVEERATAAFTSQDSGTFTTISSNGTLANTAIIWAVERPAIGAGITARALSAYDAATGATLKQLNAGAWSHLTGNSNIVPLVANGKVYVASDKVLAIFGLTGAAPVAAEAPLPPVAANAPEPLPGLRRLSGTVSDGASDAFTLATRAGMQVSVSAAPATALALDIPVHVGDAVEVQGAFDANGVFQASVVSHAKTPEAWAPDR